MLAPPHRVIVRIYNPDEIAYVEALWGQAYMGRSFTASLSAEYREHDC